jgi:hypothetical protein
MFIILKTINAKKILFIKYLNEFLFNFIPIKKKEKQNFKKLRNYFEIKVLLKHEMRVKFLFFIN